MKALNADAADRGILIVRSGQFGLDGTVVDRLGLDASSDQIKDALLNANQRFSTVEKRKDYQSHVQAGRRQGIKYESVIPYGEDRDGDGEIDRRGSSRGQRGGRRGRDR